MKEANKRTIKAVISFLIACIPFIVAGLLIPDTGWKLAVGLMLLLLIPFLAKFIFTTWQK